MERVWRVEIVRRYFPLFSHFSYFHYPGWGQRILLRIIVGGDFRKYVKGELIDSHKRRLL